MSTTTTTPDLVARHTAIETASELAAWAAECYEHGDELLEESEQLRADYRLAPWSVPATCRCIDDDGGADFTAVFADGSRARWINAERAWTVLEAEPLAPTE